MNAVLKLFLLLGVWAISFSISRADMVLADNITVTGSLTVDGVGSIRASAPLSATASGGAVWAYATQSALIWNPDNANFFVGFESEYDRSIEIGQIGAGKILLGRDNSIGGNDSVAIGRGNRMEFDVTDSIAALGSAVGGSPNNVAIGSSYIYGSYSFAIANSTIEYGNNSAAINSGYVYYSDYAFAAGMAMIDPGGDFSFAFGASSVMPISENGGCAYSFAVGGATVYGNYCFAGAGGSALGNYTFAVGKGTVAVTDGSFALGMYNRGDSSVPALHDEDGGQYLRYDTDPLFELGNGTGSSTALRSNAITVLKNGKTSLENKYWDASNPIDIPEHSEFIHYMPWEYDEDHVVEIEKSSAGVALEVKGHAVMKGNTTLEGNVTMTRPQGDILMGVFGGEAEGTGTGSGE